MKTRNSALCALGLAAAITLGGAVTAAAQDTTRARSQTRIPVRKGEAAAPAQARVDTVTVTRTDTVVRTRTDTVTVTRVDTVTRIEELPLQPLGSFQFGVGVGAALPTGDWRNVTKDGFDIHAHLGWFPGASVFGLRLDGDYVSMGGRDEDCSGCPGAKLISVSGNAVLRFALDRKSPVNPQFYVLGGGGLDWFQDFTPYRTTERPSRVVTAGADTYRGAGSVAPGTSNLGDDQLYHWNVGGGIQLGRFFIESKYVAINTKAVPGNDTKASAYVPIIIGLNF